MSRGRGRSWAERMGLALCYNSYVVLVLGSVGKSIYSPCRCRMPLLFMDRTSLFLHEYITWRLESFKKVKWKRWTNLNLHNCWTHQNFRWLLEELMEGWDNQVSTQSVCAYELRKIKFIPSILLLNSIKLSSSINFRPILLKFYYVQRNLIVEWRNFSSTRVLKINWGLPFDFIRSGT